MMTNTYLPHVGGVARSVSTFAEDYRRLGHDVLVVAPRYEGPPPPARQERGVERLAAMQHFNGSDFAVRLPLAAALSPRIDAFAADVMHAHHPFLLGDTALRVAALKGAPVVFTHHTLYEDYTHYVPFDSPFLKEVAVNLSTQFANLCQGVIAPSESIARLVRERGVTTPVRVVPTGIDVGAFARGDGARARRCLGLPAGAFVAGSAGRLAPEKNLAFLADAAVRFLRRFPAARFLLVGAGPAEAEVRRAARAGGVAKRVVLPGSRTGAALRDAFNAMDVFLFASHTETQGLVLAEAMAAGLPVVALAASGVVEIVRDDGNGILLAARAEAAEFAAAVGALATDRGRRRRLAEAARATAREFSRRRCARRALEFYDEVRAAHGAGPAGAAARPWRALAQRLAIEWELFAQRTQGVIAALQHRHAGERSGG